MRAAPTAQIGLHVALYDRIKRRQLDKTYRFQRGDATEQIVDFQMLPGVYRLELSAPAYGCNREDFLALLPSRTRQVSEQLVDGPAPPTYPMLEGTVPQSFLYASPTFVLFDRTAQCNKPAGDPLQVRITLENDEDAYYIWLYPDPAVVAQAPVTLALQLGTSTGENHYIRVRIPFPRPWAGWPYVVQFNVSEDVLDGLAGYPVDTLLCPKLYETEVG
jgi:hypothetical protein